MNELVIKERRAEAASCRGGLAVTTFAELIPLVPSHFTNDT